MKFYKQKIKQKTDPWKFLLHKSEEKSICDQITYSFNVRISKGLHQQQNQFAWFPPKS